ncbi:tubulointerstitial nephritis antigen isoform X2 [Lissotriton helveticus]
MIGIKCQILILCYFALHLPSVETVISGRNLTVNFYSDGSLQMTSRSKRALSEGHYCRNRGCCPQRDDSCKLPYFEKNATCYCDLFCDKEPIGHVDCCPDFWAACQGEKPSELQTQSTPLPFSTDFTTPMGLPGCIHDGTHYEEESAIKENCNYCICIATKWKCTENICLVRPKQIELINSRHYSWKAANYSMFWGLTLEDGFKHRLGTFPPSPALLAMNEMTIDTTIYTRAELPPASWYEKMWLVEGVAADRIAIHSNGIFKENLSPQNLISCDINNQYGCNGGSIDSAWWYLRKRGLVSHACYPFDANNDEKPYSCHLRSAYNQYGKRYIIDQCPNKIEKSNQIYQCSPPYRVPFNESQIMKEIMDNGPVQAVMQVHEDFFLYKTGIYRHTDETIDKPEQYRIRGTHSVKITGWGEVKGPNGEKQKFWIVANSWGKSWGENGYFRIIRGENECGIETMIIGAWCHLLGLK